MAFNLIDKFWHKTLKRPYILSRPIETGTGKNVVLLHGLGRTGQTWKNLTKELEDKNFRFTAIDLLGFGRSPKPDWLEYDIDDHASAVIATINRLGMNKPIIIVGHSMGCLVAVRIAKRRPDLIKHLILYEMPLYDGLPYKRSYRLRTNLYRRLYDRVIVYKPTFDETARLVERLGRRVIGQEVTPETWQPFIRSLKNTIMNQTTAEDMKDLNIPMDVIYGRFDMFVIGGHIKSVFGSDNKQITSHKIRARHIITPSASHFIAERLIAATSK
jgi:pimeloyl-ACP methyl ester carboxylesterase